jgi:MFS transporter, PAT family, beta-lactamase induction signal transducer AmpG
VTRLVKSTPWLYIPTLYFIEGLPYILVNTVSVYFFKSFGLSNQFIGLASILMFPWVVKMFWAPIVDIFSTKRSWVIALQAVLAFCFWGVAAAIHLPIMVTAVVVLLFVSAFASATHDIAADGYYLLALDAQKQALFVGIRSTAYRIAMLASGGIATVAGLLERNTGRLTLSWSAAYGFVGLIFLAAAVFHRWYLPNPEIADQRVDKDSLPFIEAFRSYFQQPRIVPVLLFILLYRLGEALLNRMAVPFLLDPHAAGGLELSTASASLMRDVLGQAGMIVGGILGGWLVYKFGLRKSMLPMALALNLPDIGYWYLSIAQPDAAIAFPVIVFEQFGYGLGFTSFMVFLMSIAKGRFKTSHYAISTGFMALGLMLPGLVSGYLQNLMGYSRFFLLVLILTIPGYILIRFLPFPKESS